MIRINLKNTKTSVAQMNDSMNMEQGTGTFQTRVTGLLSSILGGLSSAEWERVDTVFFIRIAFNLILVMSIPIGLKVYEIRKINKLEIILQTEEQSLQTKKAEVESGEESIKKLGKYKKEANEFDSKKKLLKKLANQRLRIPKILEQIQTLIPKLIWLTNIELNVKEGTFSIAGKSIDDDNVIDFIEKLTVQRVIEAGPGYSTSKESTGQGFTKKINFTINGKLTEKDKI